MIAARDRLVSFATSEWLQLAPRLVSGVEGVVRGLDPGVSLGESIPDLRLAGPGAESPAPSASPSSPQPAVVPSRQPSASSTRSWNITHFSEESASSPVVQEPDTGPTARPSRPMPRVTYLRRLASSPESAPARSTAPLVVPQILVPAPTVATPAPSVASTRSSKKRSAVGISSGDRPSDWTACTHCKQQKKGCSPAKEANPPFSACTLCLRSKTACVREKAPPRALSLSLSF